MTADDLPPALAAFADVVFEYEDETGIDYEPWPAFEDRDEVTDWLRDWTGNAEAEGDAFRVFGRDGTGGKVALWCVRPSEPLAEQPVVLLGSEGETVVVAANVSDFLWLLASGVGPVEVADDDLDRGEAQAEAVAIADQHATPPRRSVAEVLDAARPLQPELEALVESMLDE